MKNHKGNFAFLFLILLIFGLAVFLMRNPSTGADSYSYSDIYDLLMQEKVNSVTLRGTDLTLKLKQPDEDGNTTVTYQVASFAVFYQDFNDLIVDQYDRGIIKSYDYPAPSETPWWLMFVPYLLIALLFLGIWVFMMSRASEGGGGGEKGVMRFAKARAVAATDTGVTFDELLSAVFAAYGLAMSLPQYALMGSTVRSYLSYLMDAGQVAAQPDGTRLIWQRI